MGRVRTKTVKKSARQIIEKYYSKLTLDFQINKKVCDEIAVLPSKRMRNKISGYVTKLMKRIQRGPVRGISLKLQEEERERRMDFVPTVSALSKSRILIDSDTKDLLAKLRANVPNAQLPPVKPKRDDKAKGRKGRDGKSRDGKKRTFNKSRGGAANRKPREPKQQAAPATTEAAPAAE